MSLSLQQIARALGGEVSGNQVRAPGPGHSPKDRSLSVKLDAAAPGGFVVYTHSLKDNSIHCKDYVCEKLGLPPWSDRSAHAGKSRNNGGRNGGDKVDSKVVAEYDYTDEAGELQFQVVRYDHPKGFSQRRPDGKGGWIWKLDDVRRVLYRLPALLQAVELERTIFIAEGEKAVDALVNIGVTATCSPGGAGKWRDEYSQHLKGSDVVILPDNDEPGEKHAEAVARFLHGVATRIRILRLAGIPTGGDVYDWISQGGTADQLVQTVDHADEYQRREQSSDSSDTGVSLIKSSRDFVADFIPPDYLIEGLLQRRYFYSLTARTGDGKTAVALTMAAHSALGKPLGEREVTQSKVLYFAGENPTDVKMRWIAMAERMGFDVNAIDVYFVEGAFHFKNVADRVRKEVEARGIAFSLIIIDTSAAYFDGDQENDNTQQGDYARRLRSLTKLAGGPTVLALCHPVKNATDTNLIPRGGGAYLAEVDGNLTCLLKDTTVEFYWQGKFRGIDFEPLHFELRTVTCAKLKDAKSRPIPTVMAELLTAQRQEQLKTTARNDEDALLIYMHENPNLPSQRNIAKALNWATGSMSEPHHSKVRRAFGRLKNAKLAALERDQWGLTEKGKEEAKRIIKGVGDEDEGSDD